MTGNVEEADIRRSEILREIEDLYTERHSDSTVLQALYMAIDHGNLDVQDVGLITIEDVVNVRDKVDQSIKYGERFEVITDLQDRLNEMWNQYEEGVISLPSFVTRFEDALLQITEACPD